MLLLDHKAAMTDAPIPEPEAETERSIRVAIDLADMLGWIVYFERKKPKANRRTVAQIADPMLRDDVVEAFTPFRKDVTRIAKALGLEVRPGTDVPPPPTRG